MSLRVPLYFWTLFEIGRKFRFFGSENANRAPNGPRFARPDARPAPQSPRPYRGDARPPRIPTRAFVSPFAHFDRFAMDWLVVRATSLLNDVDVDAADLHGLLCRCFPPEHIRMTGFRVQMRVDRGALPTTGDSSFRMMLAVDTPQDVVSVPAEIFAIAEGTDIENLAYVSMVTGGKRPPAPIGGIGGIWPTTQIDLDQRHGEATGLWNARRILEIHQLTFEEVAEPRESKRVKTKPKAYEAVPAPPPSVAKKEAAAK